MRELVRFRESVKILQDGVTEGMNTELKRLESGFEELKEGNQRVKREIESLEDSDFEYYVNHINSVLKELAIGKHHHQKNQNQLTEDMIVHNLVEKKGSVLDIVERMIQEIEGVEKDEKTQLLEDEDAYEKIKQALKEESLEKDERNAIDEHRAILILKKDLKIAKGNSEFQDHLREELDKINYEYDDIDELIQEVQQFQEDSFDILKEIEDLLKGYKDNLEHLASELENTQKGLANGQKSTLGLLTRLRNHCVEENLDDGQEASEKVIRRVKQLNEHVNAAEELEEKVDLEINNVLKGLRSYIDQYKAEENII